MTQVRELWKDSDRVSLFLIALMLLLALLLAGLILTDRSLRHSTDQQATLDATASATIMAQEVQLAGEWLHEVSAASRQQSTEHPLSVLGRNEGKTNALRAVWLFDSLGVGLIDSILWDSVGTDRIPPGTVEALARHVAESRQLQLQGLSRAGTKHPGQALLGEPIIDDGIFANVAIALVDERSLLAPAANAAVEGRSFLALLVDGDTVVETPHRGRTTRQSAPVRLPLPGKPEWFIISAQASGSDATRWAIWLIGSTAVGLLFLGLLRERRQTLRIAERSLELERLSAELLRANRMKSEFLASVSHELRTPLNAIVGFVDLLRDGGYGELSPKQISPVERIATSAARLRTLVDQVLDIAKIAAGRLDVRLETVTLRPFLVNVVSEIEPLVNERGLRVSIDASPDGPKIRTDPTHLRQILINLLGNAVKYTRQGGIEIRTRVETLGPAPRSLAVTGQHAVPRLEQRGGWLAIDVKDTGIGIASADQERIFEEFEQVRPGAPQDERERGTGLGLPISRRLAALLGGEITVESEVGRGSVFTVWLPIRD